MVAAHPGSVITFYAEIFGGKYPHPDVPAGGKRKPVQQGIWYSAAHRIVVFDVLINGTVYLDVADAAALCKQVQSYVIYHRDVIS